MNDLTSSRVEVGLRSRDGDRVLPGGTVVYGVAEGDTSYDSIHVVYRAVKDFIAANGLEQRGPTREVYLGAPEFFSVIEVVWPVR